MSGEGVIPAGRGERPVDQRVIGRGKERDDVIAYLARRKANAEAIAATKGLDDETVDQARDRARQLAVVIGDIETGLHVGAAGVAAAQAAKAKEQG